MLLFISCAKDQAIRPASETNSASVARSVVNTQEVGKDLFKGLYFMQGSIAEKLPSIYNSKTYYLVNKAQSPELVEKTERLIAAIQAKDPVYFSGFYEVMSSGNHVVIQKSLNQGAELLRKTASDLFLSEAEKVRLAEMVASPMASANVAELSQGVVVVTAMAVIATMAIAVTKYIAIAGHHNTMSLATVERSLLHAPEHLDDRNITTELLVNDIATLLKQ